MEQDIDKLLNSLQKSKFRGSFHLNKKLIEYANNKGINELTKQAYFFINQRLKPKIILNDGKQTPMKQVNPIFIAQHATGTCCRKCLERIHHIKNNKELNDKEIDYIVKVIIKWIKREISN